MCKDRRVAAWARVAAAWGYGLRQGRTNHCWRGGLEGAKRGWDHGSDTVPGWASGT